MKETGGKNKHNQTYENYDSEDACEKGGNMDTQDLTLYMELY